jgi:putative acyl-CoA dehydrogenase
MTGIHPHNQVPDLEGYNLYTTDPVLRAAVARGGAGWHDAELARQGAEYGAAETLQAATDANRFKPELHTLSRQGERIDEVRFHPGWHTLVAMARRNGITHLPYTDTRASAWVAYGATLFMHAQIESGSMCPSVMTKASMPVVRQNAALDAVLAPRFASSEHDARDIPLARKRSITVGMGMTEKQGGSDLRSNETLATPAGSGEWGDEFLLDGHKWFFSAPMCDGHLVLAKTAERGSTCFFVPRWRPDGTKNRIEIQRLKDKVGNCSNASSEVEFHGAWGVRVGGEGRGIPTIIEMASFTRLDCALGSAGFIRQAFAQALFYARNRQAFGKALAEQPLMTELLADMALESESATMLAMALASRFGNESGNDTALDNAWRRLLTPAAKFWICKRAVSVAGEAMEVFGGNGYVETGPMGRLYREVPVNSIWEGSGNVMCLDVLRAVSRHPEDMQLLAEHLAPIASQDKRIAQQLASLQTMLRLPGTELERQARRFTQRLVLVVQACLMLQHASRAASDAFIGSRFDADWGAVTGIGSGTDDPAALLAAAWA